MVQSAFNSQWDIALLLQDSPNAGLAALELYEGGLQRQQRYSGDHLAWLYSLVNDAQDGGMKTALRQKTFCHWEKGFALLAQAVEAGDEISAQNLFYQRIVRPFIALQPVLNLQVFVGGHAAVPQELSKLITHMHENSAQPGFRAFLEAKLTEDFNDDFTAFDPVVAMMFGNSDYDRQLIALG